MTDKIEGSIEEVGIRSTRVRTTEDSIVIVPNGKLADSTINNLGTRRHHLVRMQLLVTGGGSPENIDAFTTAVRQRMVDDQAFIPKRLRVFISGISKAGIEVELNGYLNTSSSSAESATRHQLLMDVMTIASQSGLTLGDGMVRKEKPAEANSAPPSPAQATPASPTS